MALLQDETEELQNPPLILDELYCDETSFDNDDDEYGDDFGSGRCKQESVVLPSLHLEHESFWDDDDDELSTLVSKEKETHVCFDLISDGFLMLARKEAVEWIFRVKSLYGFNALTTILAVNYFDRFISRLMLQRDKPWMSQLVAVACLSLAAKVEETQVPFLLDLQVEESKFVFEAKTIQRMELLVLSTLQWRMNPVTSISFFDHILRRRLKTHLHWEFLCRCESLLLSVIADSRSRCYPPSVLATSIMMHVIKEIEPCNYAKHQNQLMGVLKIREEKVNECYVLILESLSLGRSHNQSHKRKHLPPPGTPNGVFEALFSCDSSNDSWGAASSVSSSPQPRYKRFRAHVQEMRLSSLNRTFVDAISSPY